MRLDFREGKFFPSILLLFLLKIKGDEEFKWPSMHSHPPAGTFFRLSPYVSPAKPKRRTYSQFF